MVMFPPLPIGLIIIRAILATTLRIRYHFFELIDRIGGTAPMEHFVAIRTNREKILNRIDLLRLAFESSQRRQMVNVNIANPDCPILRREIKATHGA